jgi:hypothetical protein
MSVPTFRSFNGYPRQFEPELNVGGIVVNDELLTGRFQDVVNDDGGRVVQVRGLDDLPAAVSGVISLPANSTYVFTGAVDLLGARIMCLGHSVLQGSHNILSSLTSTGLGSSTALITSTKSVNMIRLTVKNVGTLFDLQGASVESIEWFDFTALNVPDMGTIKNYTNFIATSSAISGSAKMKFDGEIGTLGFRNCFLQGVVDETTLDIRSTCEITRRIKIVGCAVVNSGTFLTIRAGATIPDQAVIIDDCNFAGASSTYFSGVTKSDDIANFRANDGIDNSRSVGGFYLIGNATATVISTINAWVKVAGTTTIAAAAERFSMPSSNRLQYDGVIQKSFLIFFTAGVVGGNARDFELGVYSSSLGGIIPASRASQTTDGTTKVKSTSLATTLFMDPGDFFEIHIRNTEDTSNLTVKQLTVTVVPA